MPDKNLVWVVDDDESIRWVLEKGLSENGLKVETFESAHQVLKKQITEGLRNVKKIDNILFAYEPVWSIGTGVIPKIDDLQKQLHTLKKFISKKFNYKNPILLYGGSVNKRNAVDFLNNSNIDGLLVGGASLNFNSFYLKVCTH